MKKKYLFIFFTTFSLLPLLSLAQTIKGRIKDASNHTGIAFATVFADAAHKTITNENGEFELKIATLPADIIISHISYEPKKIKLVKEQDIDVSLNPVSLNLNEVVVGSYAPSLMKNVYEKAKHYQDEPQYARAFLRQVAYENEQPASLNEIYSDADWRTYGLLKWNPTESRYLKKDNHISYTNLSFATFLLSGFMSNSVYAKPLSPKMDSVYIYKIKNTYKAGDQEIAVVSCTIKIKTEKPYFEGDYYIDTETYDVLKIDGTLKNFSLNSKGLMGLKLKEIGLTAQYNVNKQGKSILDFCTLVLKSKMTVLGIGAKTTELYNTLYAIDYNDRYNKDLKDIQRKTNDVETATGITYNPQFWKDNQTIKRTLKEEEAIKILEEAPKAKK